MRVKAKTAFGLLAAGVTLYVAGAGWRAHADDDVPSIEGSWRITISAPPNCQGAPPACNTAAELSNFYRGGTLTETNTVLFATSEPNPPNFSSGSDGYGRAYASLNRTTMGAGTVPEAANALRIARTVQWTGSCTAFTAKSTCGSRPLLYRS